MRGPWRDRRGARDTIDGVTSRLTPSTAALLVLPPLFWAGNAVVGRALVGHFPPLALSFWRWALAFAILLPFAARVDPGASRGTIRTHWRALVVLSFLGVACYNSLQYLALQTSGAVNATLIGASGPVAGLLIGAAFYQARVTHRQWIGAALSAAGVLWVIARGDLANLLALRFAMGDLIMLVATVLWSFYTWMLRRQRPPLPMTAFLAVQIGLGALMILPLYLIELAIAQRAPEADGLQLRGPRLRGRAALDRRVLLLGPGRGARGRRPADVLRQPDAGVHRRAGDALPR